MTPISSLCRDHKNARDGSQNSYHNAFPHSSLAVRRRNTPAFAQRIAQKHQPLPATQRNQSQAYSTPLRRKRSPFGSRKYLKSPDFPTRDQVVCEQKMCQPRNPRYKYPHRTHAGERVSVLRPCLKEPRPARLPSCERTWGSFTSNLYYHHSTPAPLPRRRCSPRLERDS